MMLASLLARNEWSVVKFLSFLRSNNPLPQAHEFSMMMPTHPSASASLLVPNEWSVMNSLSFQAIVVKSTHSFDFESLVTSKYRQSVDFLYILHSIHLLLLVILSSNHLLLRARWFLVIANTGSFVCTEVIY